MRGANKFYYKRKKERKNKFKLFMREKAREVRTHDV